MGSMASADFLCRAMHGINDVCHLWGQFIFVRQKIDGKG